MEGAGVGREGVKALCGDFVLERLGERVGETGQV